MSSEELAPINEKDFKDLKERMKLIVDADPKQYHNDFSLRRYLRAFKTTDDAFQVSDSYTYKVTSTLKSEAYYLITKYLFKFASINK